MIASLAGREAVRAGYPVRTSDQSTQSQQNAQENKGTYTRVPSVVFLTTAFHGMSYPASLRTCGRYDFFLSILRYSSEPAFRDTSSGQYPNFLSPFSRIFYPLLSQTPSVKPFPARLFTYSLFKDEIVPFFVNRIKRSLTKYR